MHAIQKVYNPHCEIRQGKVYTSSHFLQDHHKMHLSLSQDFALKPKYPKYTAVTSVSIYGILKTGPK